MDIERLSVDRPARQCSRNSAQLTRTGFIPMFFKKLILSVAVVNSITFDFGYKKAFSNDEQGPCVFSINLKKV